MDALILFFARWFPWVIMSIVGVILFYYHRKHPKKFFQEVIIIIGTTFVAWGISVLFKLFIYAPRPFVVNGTPNIFLVGDTTSFPSGHTVIFFALAAAFYLHRQKTTGIFFFIAAALVAISRVIAGAHYLIDILAGAMIGILVAYLFEKVFWKMVKKKG